MINSVLKNKFYVLLLLIVFLAGALRFYKVSEVPVSLYWDEVSSAYNAYSIASTGKDEFGNSHPILFRAFEDYKTPANIYLTAISVRLFGLNEFSARFTSAFLGTLTVLLTFFLIKQILSKKFLGRKILPVSPFHLYLQKIGWDEPKIVMRAWLLGFFFAILGLYIAFIR